MVRNKKTKFRPFDPSIHPAGRSSNSENASTPASSSAPLPVGRTDDSLKNSKPPDRKPDSIDSNQSKLLQKSSNSTIPKSNANNDRSSDWLQSEKEVSNSSGRPFMTCDSNRTVTDNKLGESSCSGSSNRRSRSKDTKKSDDGNDESSQRGERDSRGPLRTDSSSRRSRSKDTKKSKDDNVKRSQKAEKDSWGPSRSESSSRRSHSKDTKKNKDDDLKTSQKLETKNTIKVGKAMFEFVKGDLFHADDDFSLAHCVGEDLAMGAGIAVGFRKMFRNVGSLMDQQVKTGGVAILPLPKRFVYYLITKRVSTGKPTMLSLKSSLEKMKEHIIEHRVTKLAIPEIGSGLDRLDWDLVERFLKDLLQDVAIHIQIYHYVPDNSPPAFEYSNKVIHKDMDLVRIERGTALIYIGSVIDVITNSIKSLDGKYDFIKEYLHTKRELGDVVKIETRPDFTYGFICVDKDGRFSYEMFDQCVEKFRNLNTYDLYEYMGISSIKSPNDEQLMLKIENLIKYPRKLEIQLWICNPVSYGSDEFDVLNFRPAEKTDEQWRTSSDGSFYFKRPSNYDWRQ